jgi:hypothetical protein
MAMGPSGFQLWPARRPLRTGLIEEETRGAGPAAAIPKPISNASCKPQAKDSPMTRRNCALQCETEFLEEFIVHNSTAAQKDSPAARQLALSRP